MNISYKYIKPRHYKSRHDVLKVPTLNGRVQVSQRDGLVILSSGTFNGFNKVSLEGLSEVYDLDTFYDTI